MFDRNFIKKQLFLLFSLIVPTALWGQIYDSTNKRYYYRFVSQNHHEPILKYSSTFPGKTNVVNICGLVTDKNKKALSNVKCEIVRMSDFDTITIYSDKYGKFETSFISDTITIKLSQQHYSQYIYEGIDLTNINNAEYEFVLPANLGTLIAKFRPKRRMSRRRIDKIQKWIDEEAIKEPEK